MVLGTIGPPASLPNGNAVQPDSEATNGDEEALPPGWEMRFDTFGRRYYVDHNTRWVALLQVKVNYVSVNQ